MSAQVNSVFTGRDESLSRTLRNIEGSATRLDKVLGTLRGRVRTALEFHVINRGIALFERGIHRVLGLLPELIGRGERWASTVDAIADATGLSAEQASELAAIQQRVGGSTDALARGFVALSRSVYTNRDAWKDMGVQVALNRDGSVDAYQTFQNLRQAIAATGGSLLSTAAAQTALGRGGRDLLDLLQLNDRQYRMLAADARASGQVMSEAAARAAESWERAKQRVGSVLDGLGSQILTGLAPVLTRFADGFSDWISRNMESIVRLVVGAANTVLTVIGDLVGIDLGQWSFTEQVAAATPRVRDLTGGLRDMSQAHDKAARATAGHAKEQRRLLAELEQAQRQLRTEQARSALFSRMSAYESERWRQEKARRVKDAQERVAEARKALAEHRRTLDAMTADARAAGIRMADAMNRPFRVKRKGRGGAVADVFGGLGQVIADSTATGHTIADAIKDAIFGDEQLVTVFGGSGSPQTFEIRSGGLLDQLGKVGGFLSTVAGHLSNLNLLLDGPGGLIAAVLGLGALIRMVPGVGTVTGAGSSLLGTVGGFITGALRRGGGALASHGQTVGGARSIRAGAGILGASVLNALLREPGPQRPDEYGGGIFGSMSGIDVALAAIGPQLGAAGRAPRGALGALLGSIFNGRPGRGWGARSQQNDLLAGIAADYAMVPVTTAGPDGVHARSIGRPGPGGMFGPQGAGIADPYALLFDRSLRRYLGVSSPIVMGQQDQMGLQAGIYGAAQATAEQTAPLGAGQMPVLVQNQSLPIFGNVGATIQNQAVAITGNVGALVQNTDLTVRGRVDSVVQNTTLQVNGQVYASLVSAQEELLRDTVVNTGMIRVDLVDRLKGLINSNGLLVRMAGGSGGGGSLADRVGVLESRVGTISRRNVEQDKRMDGIVNVNRTQSSQISQRVTKTDFNKNIKRIDGVNNGQRQLLKVHEDRLDRLDGGGGDPKLQAATATASQRTSDNTAQMLVLLRQIRDNTRTGSAAGRTSSLRPAS